MAAADAVADALREHARMCLTVPTNASAVVTAGETLVSAVQSYEQLLGDHTGWSNPLRHLRSVSAPAGPDEVVSNDSAASDQVRVLVTFEIEVIDENRLANLVEGRGGDRPTNSVDAVQALAESDGWDPRQYPTGILNLAAATVEAHETRKSGPEQEE